MTRYMLFLVIIMLAACQNTPKATRTIGSVERIDAALDAVLDKDVEIEVIGEGYEWSEGPVWVEANKMLLFSDIPPNKIFKWTEEKGVELYLTPSGYTGSKPRTGEPGSNGLLINNDGKLVLCQHGDRRIALMDADISKPEAKFISISDNYEGKKFNSPNDAVMKSNGDIFFTDPPYGLEKNIDDPAKEIPFQGVFLVKKDGALKLLTDSITRPNGIALMNNEKTLIIANSDGEKANWYLYDIADNDSLYNGRIMYNATAEMKKEGGAPDGLKIDQQGNIFSSGPGGVWIFDKTGKVIGKFKIPQSCSNVALADNDKTLFITADSYLLRVKLRK